MMTREMRRQPSLPSIMTLLSLIRQSSRRSRDRLQCQRLRPLQPHRSQSRPGPPRSRQCMAMCQPQHGGQRLHLNPRQDLLVLVTPQTHPPAAASSLSRRRSSLRAPSPPRRDHVALQPLPRLQFTSRTLQLLLPWPLLLASRLLPLLSSNTAPPGPLLKVAFLLASTELVRRTLPWTR